MHTEHIQEAPSGWKVRTLTWPSGHEIRLAFPPGPRKRGSGRLVSILHPHNQKTRGRGRNACPKANAITYFEVWKHGKGGPELVKVERDEKAARQFASAAGKKDGAKY